MNLRPNFNRSVQRRLPSRSRSTDICLRDISNAKRSVDVRKESVSGRPQAPQRSNSEKETRVLVDRKETSMQREARRVPNRSRSELSSRSSDWARISAASRRMGEKASQSSTKDMNSRDQPLSDEEQTEDSHSDSREDFSLARSGSWNMTGNRNRFMMENAPSSQQPVVTRKEESEPPSRRGLTPKRSFMKLIRSALPCRTQAAPVRIIPQASETLSFTTGTSDQEILDLQSEDPVEFDLLDLPLEDPAAKTGRKPRGFESTTEESMMASLPKLTMSAEDEEMLRREYGVGSNSSRAFDDFSPCDHASDDNNSDMQPIDKHVRFSPKVKAHPIPTCKKMTRSQKQDLWFNAQDREQTRKSAKSTVFRASLKTPNHVRSLDSAYNNACYLAATLRDANLDTFYTSKSALDRHGKSLLAYSCLQNTGAAAASTETTRGLEVLVSDVHNAGREEIASESRNMVVATSKLQKQRRNGRAGGLHELESISRQYQEMSKSAVILARLFGHADAAAAAAFQEHDSLSPARLHV